MLIWGYTAPAYGPRGIRNSVNGKGDNKKTFKILVAQINKGHRFEGLLYTYAEFETKLMMRGTPEFNDMWNYCRRSANNEIMSNTKNRHNKVLCPTIVGLTSAKVCSFHFLPSMF